MLSDPIADMLTRIRNATRTHKETVDVPASKFKEQLAKLLVAEGYVASYERLLPEGQKFDVLRLTLKYGASASRSSSTSSASAAPAAART